MWIASFFLCDRQQNILFNLFKEFGQNISYIITVFFASGGIGYLLSIIYHKLYWCCQNNDFKEDKNDTCKLVVDHRPTIECLIKNKFLYLKNRNNCKIENIDCMKRSEAWSIVTALWHERVESSKRIKGANNRIDSLTDLYHGMGTMLIGSIISFIIFFAVFFKVFDWNDVSNRIWFFIFLFIVFLIIIYSQFSGYKHLAIQFQNIIHMILIDEFKNSYCSTSVYFPSYASRKSQVCCIIQDIKSVFKPLRNFLCK